MSGGSDSHGVKPNSQGFDTGSQGAVPRLEDFPKELGIEICCQSPVVYSCLFDEVDVD